jgi:hypothetical protein
VKKIGYFITVGVIVQRYDGSKMMVKETDGSGWSSDDVVMCLRRGKNRDAVEWWGYWSRLR